ncbi:MAG: response regulator [Chitinophagales bacterium]
MLNQLPILVADDDDDDKQMLKYAFEENQVVNPLLFVEDGEHLLRMLDEMAAQQLLPAVIMLDLNMPKMDGREALKRIKNHPDLKGFP